MKIKLISIISLLLVCSSGNIFGQDPSELILQMSQRYSGGTARMMGLGGSKVSLGGDAGNIYLNPAGLGFYNRSEVVFSPQFDFTHSNTDYLDNNSNGYKLNFNISNLGVVFNRSKDISSEDKWRGGSFAFSLNRINDYHFNTDYSGQNTSQDIIDYAVEDDLFVDVYNRQNNGNLPYSNISDFLYNTTLTERFYELYQGQDSISINGYMHDINDLFGDVQMGDSLFFTDRNIYRNGDPAFPTEESPTYQREEVRSRGAEYAASFSYGGNYADRIYFGVGINLMSIDKRIERTYYEQPTGADLTRLLFTDEYSLTGSGASLTLGIIGRPINNVLIGLSYTSPTYYALEEAQDLEMIATFDTGSESDYLIIPSFYYDLNMPSRLRGGITYFFGKSGFISADIETTNTQNARILNSTDIGFEDNTNNTVSGFQQTVSAGVGGELRLNSFRVRGGFNYITDPSASEELDFDRYLYSVGVGFRKRHFFADIAYTGSQFTQAISPYPTAELAVSKLSNNYITTSIGFTF